MLGLQEYYMYYSICTAITTAVDTITTGVQQDYAMWYTRLHYMVYDTSCYVM